MPIQTEQGPKLTYADYVRIPDDGRRHEIIEGRHIVSAAPRSRHQIVIYSLGLAVQDLQHTGRAQVIPSAIDVQLTEFDVVQPDLIAISAERREMIGELKVDGAPDLVVEVLSPSTRRLDRGAKRALYESCGVREYWIVDPESRTLCQHTLVGGLYEEVLHTTGSVDSTAFSGITVRLENLFADLGPADPAGST